MILVLDASAAVRICLDVRGRKLAPAVQEAEIVLAPSLFVAEVVNTFWKYCNAGQLSRPEGERGVGAALGLVDEFAPMEAFSMEALDAALLMKRPAYDMFYLVLARRNSATLLSADRTLLEGARRLGVRTWEGPA